MTAREINLLPQDVKAKHKEEKVKSSLGKLFLILLIVSGALSFISSALLVQANLSQNKIKEEISRNNGKIKDLGIIEGEAQRLDKKIIALSTVVAHRQRFSLLLLAIGKSIPQEISINNLATFAEDKLSVSGFSASYQSLSNFITALLDSTLGGKVFAAADLTSASLDEVSGKIRFALTLYLKPNSLK